MYAHIQTKVVENWLTQKPKASAGALATLSTLLLFLLALLFFSNYTDSQAWMPASYRSAVEQQDYWRLWTTLFAHADLGHLLSNALLFVPLSFMLGSHFSPIFFPLAAVLLGGLTNYLVLLTLPEKAQLIGISGVVYWMGAAWLTLYLLIDRRDRLSRRFGAALFLTLMLFVPETLKPEVSHLSHFLGYVIGVFSAFAYYLVNRKKFLAAEKLIYIYEPDFRSQHEPDFRSHDDPELSPPLTEETGDNETSPGHPLSAPKCNMR